MDPSSPSQAINSPKFAKLESELESSERTDPPCDPIAFVRWLAPLKSSQFGRVASEVIALPASSRASAKLASIRRLLLVPYEWRGIKAKECS